jgi:bifunctional DNase/RNase
MDNLVQVYVKRLTFQNNKNFRIIELGELFGNRMMHIVIGSFEAEYIAAVMNNKVFKRPMPYDVIADILKSYRIELCEIIIFAIRSKVLYSRLMLRQGNDVQEIVVRISDALALAIQTGAPIFIEKNILDVFFKMIDNKIEQYLDGNIPLAELNVEELKKEMANAVEDENYERAAEIRDEIKIRENKLKTNN